MTSSSEPVPVIKAVRLLDRCPSDIVLHYQGTEFYVHTYVLYHHSSYFRVLLQTFLKPQNGEVTNGDYDAATLVSSTVSAYLTRSVL